MVLIRRSTAIPREPAQVWTALAEFDAISLWAPNVDHSCLMTEQAEGVGTVRRIQTGRMTVRETVIAYEPGRVLGYEISGLPKAIDSVTNTWTLEPDGAATRVTLTTEIVPGPRPPHRAVARAVGKALGDASDQMLEGLAEHLAKENVDG
jgi:uncharacterized protein YndB with AHSA1/START domain